MRPAGCVTIAEAVAVVGQREYGDKWAGDRADVLMRLAAPLRLKGPKSTAETALLMQADAASTQRNEVIRFLGREFRGTPPNFDDAVSTSMLADDDGSLHALPPQVWINDQDAWQLLTSGRVIFSPGTRFWRWSPRGRVSGEILLAQSALNASAGGVAETAVPEGFRPGIQTTRERAAEQKAGHWIAELEERPRSKSWALEECRKAVAAVGSLSDKAFMRAWAANIRPEWTKGGRRKKT